MKAIFSLAILTFKEHLRRKIFVVTLLMMFIVAGFGLIANPFTIGTQARLMRDLALLFIQMYLVFLGMALGATALPNEIERKTLYPFLAKPISRGQYLWGKCFAIMAVILLNAFILGLELMLVVKISSGEAPVMILGASFLSALEATVIASFCLFFSTFMTMAVTFASMLLLYVIGSLSHVYIEALTYDNQIMQWVFSRLKSLIPYFDYFSIRSAVTHNYSISPSYLAACVLYGFLYVVIAMLLAEASFAWKDL